ncbi:hypothetical protein B0J14DRAFT_658488 [Halenospora varia]|nr:hypothetical protein B0J14DRAFT_658488 [Halenospora varia]
MEMIRLVFSVTGGISKQPLIYWYRDASTIKGLRGWYTGTYAEIANTKRGHMDKNGFKDIIAEFAPKFEGRKQLARELRSVLFPIKDGAIFTGTFRDHDIMYDGMINAFSRTIGRLGKEERAIA